MKHFALRLTSLVLALMLLTGSAALADAGSTYLYAQELLAQSKFAEAAEKFASIGSYEDASLLAMYCRACAMCEAGDYVDGIAVLKAMGDYKDCPYRATYYEARQLEDKGGTDNWHAMEEAQDIYSLVRIYYFLDGAERYSALFDRIAAAKYAQYTAAVEAGESGEYDTARRSFLDLGDYYSDSGRRYTYYGIRADEADLTDASTAKAVQAVADRYTDMGEYLDCAARADALTSRATTILDSQYEAAVALMNEGKYSEAYAAFTALLGYKDSADKAAEACQHLPVTYNVTGRGFSSDITLTVAADPNGKIISIEVDASGEVLGTRCSEDQAFLNQFIGKSLPLTEEVDVLSGATVTSNAIIAALQAIAR